MAELKFMRDEINTRKASYYLQTVTRHRGTDEGSIKENVTRRVVKVFISPKIAMTMLQRQHKAIEKCL